MTLKTIIGTIGIAFAASMGTALFLKQSAPAPEEVEDPWGELNESIDVREESLARFRFNLWSKSKNEVANKNLLKWGDKEEWIKKVNENVTNKGVWPESLIYIQDRSTINLAHLLRKNCYSATVLWNRQVHADNTVLEEAKKDFKDVIGQFQNKNYAQLCATNTVSEEDSKTTKVQVSSTKWTQLSNYLNTNTSKYKISDSISDEQLSPEAKEFVQQKMKEYTSSNTKTEIGKMVIGVTVFGDGTTLFESKYTGNKLFNDLKEVPVLQNVLVEK